MQTDIYYSRSFWGRRWKLRNSDRDTDYAIIIRGLRLFSYDADIMVSETNSLGSTSTKVFRYIHKKPHIRFEFAGHHYLIILHKKNRISYFENEIQFASTTMSKGNVYQSIFDEHILSTDDFISSQLASIYRISTLSDDGGGLFNIDLSPFFTKEMQPFNEHWNLNPANQ